MARGSKLKAFALLPTLALASLTVACGAGGNGSTSGDLPTVAKDDKLAALVPADVKADGKIAVGQDQSYPPNEFIDGSKPTGFDVDLGNAVGQKLGVTMEYTNASFDGIIAGLAANKYELAISSFTINAARLETVDMVSYYKAGTSLGVLKGNPENITLDTLCGRNVAVQKGTTQVEDLQDRSAACTKAGKPAITMTQLQAQTDVNLAITSKRVQAMLADSPIVDYAVKQTNGTLQTVGDPYASAPYGIAITKNRGTFAQAIQGAVQSLIDDGTYKKILDKWSLNPVGAIPRAELNPQG